MRHELYLEVFQELPKVKGFFSTKYGASEGSPYDRPDVLQQLGLEHAQPVWPVQVHKDRIAVIEQKGNAPIRIPDTDGSITDVPGVLLTTVHADCLPVYLYDPVKGAIGLVHAGWRGTAAGIAPKAAALMEQTFGCKAEDILAHIGPGISSCCFETGPEVLEEFKRNWNFAEEFASPCGEGSEKNYLDLKGINRRQLEEAGLKAKRITASSHCTCCEPEIFCSYRREGGTYRRMGAGLCLL
ncbi:peptidoglycan editing factor PgeF [Anaerovorax odorimutans]|uniref:Purine nucleoside phosphorylase n=1 Tax=Anaerovorax odorimutans TaxID=109327 RepID=A0ABT1RTS9_9FIRM|nr:peptidoglycan editing factor PgeF [Anaerovorax odorimutans]MCQ4638551.1 peptidoglycan editing factor PgeF [Anaerovorax odorimutans]